MLTTDHESATCRTHLDNLEIAFEASFHESLDIRDGLLDLETGETVGRVGLAIFGGRQDCLGHVGLVAHDDV